jgi:hypothetical protein
MWIHIHSFFIVTYCYYFLHKPVRLPHILGLHALFCVLYCQLISVEGSFEIWSWLLNIIEEDPEPHVR